MQLLVELTALHAAAYAPPERPKCAEQPTSQQPITPPQQSAPPCTWLAAPAAALDVFPKPELIATQEDLDDEHELGRLEGYRQGRLAQIDSDIEARRRLDEWLMAQGLRTHPRPATFEELKPVHEELVSQMRAVHTWAQELYEQWEVMASVAEEAGWTPRNRMDAEGYALTEPRDCTPLAPLFGSYTVLDDPVRMREALAALKGRELPILCEACANGACSLQHV